MGMNQADHCYDIILPHLLNKEQTGYDPVASEALADLCRMADPQADRIRELEREVDRLRKALNEIHHNMRESN